MPGRVSHRSVFDELFLGLWQLCTASSVLGIFRLRSSGKIAQSSWKLPIQMNKWKNTLGLKGCLSATFLDYINIYIFSFLLRVLDNILEGECVLGFGKIFAVAVESGLGSVVSSGSVCVGHTCSQATERCCLCLFSTTWWLVTSQFRCFHLEIISLSPQCSGVSCVCFCSPFFFFIFL